MPDINEITETHRRDLALRDEILLHEISAVYHRTAARLLREIQVLQKKLELEIAGGAEPSPALLIRERRLSLLLQQIEVEMARFSTAATNLTTAEQGAQVRLAVNHTIAIIGAQQPGSVATTFSRLSARAVEAIVGAASNGSPLRSLFDEFGLVTSQRIRDELIQGVALGQGTAKTARRIEGFLGGNKARALTIARTETLRAYRTSGYQTAQENSDVITGWIWISALVGSCAACISLNGTFHPITEKLESHPNCRCSMMWISENGPPQPVELGADWFARQSEEIQLEVLGKGGLAAYKAGQLSLEDFLGQSHSPRWGSMVYQRSFRDALASKGGLRLLK